MGAAGQRRDEEVKRKILVPILFLLGIALLGGGFYSGYMYSGIKYMFLREIESSSVQARNLLQRYGLTLPEDVRALNVYFRNSGPDTECWFTCKVTPEECDRLLQLWGRAPVRDRPVAIPPPRTMHGPRPLVWWNPPDNLEEASFELLRTGYDRATGTLYGYVFTI
jgi:hypothetical protein